MPDQFSNPSANTLSKPPQERWHGLDALRGGALLLGILFHAAFSFFPGDQLWTVMDTQRSGALSGIAFILHIFRMTLFFVLAGYFGRMMFHRVGTGAFIKDRLKRISLPLIIFWPIMIVCFIALMIWAVVVANGGAIPKNQPPPPPMSLATLPLTHLWFLYSLLLLYGVMLLARGLLSVLKLGPVLGRLIDQALRLTAPIGLLPLLLAIPTAAALWHHTNWHPFFGIPTPEYGFVPNRAAIIAYGTAFVLGWALHRQPEHMQRATKLWSAYLLGAAALSAYCLTSVGVKVSYFQPLPEGSKHFYVMAYALSIWCWTFGLIGLSLRVWAKESPIRRYIADASYWLYIIHLPIIMALQIWVSQWAWPAELKYAMILTISIPLMLLSYEFLVRYSFIGWVLNGKKLKRSKAKLAEKIK